MSIWQLFREHINDAGLLPGMCFRTSLLGNVPYEVRNGHVRGIVPWELQDAAIANGLRIDAALPKEGQYVLRVLAVAQEGESGRRATARD